MYMKNLWNLYKMENNINEEKIFKISEGNQMIIQKRMNTNFIYILRNILNTLNHNFMIRSPYPIYKYLYN